MTLKELLHVELDLRDLVVAIILIESLDLEHWYTSKLLNREVYMRLIVLVILLSERFNDRSNVHILLEIYRSLLIVLQSSWHFGNILCSLTLRLCAGSGC